MSFLSKVGNLIGKATDFANTYIKPLKNKVQNGLSKVGNFLDKNHETIGTIASGIGNILMNLPKGQLSDKLQSYGQTLNNVGQAFSENRPSNLARQAITQTMNNAHNQQQQIQQQRPQNQLFGTTAVNNPIQQPAFTATRAARASTSTAARSAPKSNMRRII